MAMALNRLDEMMPSSDGKARAFLRLVILLIVLGMSGQAGLNYLLNPMGRWGTRHLIPAKDDQRYYKVDLLAHANPAPEILVLGSSRSRGLDPSYISRVFSRPAFNASVEAGSVQDWLGFTGYAVSELKYPVRLLIIGVDAGDFVMHTNRQQHPANVPELRRQLAHPWFDWFKTRIYLWSPAMTRASWTVIKKWWNQTNVNGFYYDDGEDIQRKRPDARENWRPDGFNPYLPGHAASQEISISVGIHQTNTEVQPGHLKDFERLVKFAGARGIKIVAFLTPITPRLYQALTQQTNYNQTLERTRSILRTAERQGVIICEVEHLPFNYREWADPDHPGPGSSRLIVDTLYSCVARGGGP